jgi:hypothetical protein
MSKISLVKFARLAAAVYPARRLPLRVIVLPQFEVKEIINYVDFMYIVT